MLITVPGRVVNELITTWCASIEGYVFIKIIPYNTHFDIKVLCLKVKVNSSMLVRHGPEPNLHIHWFRFACSVRSP